MSFHKAVFRMRAGWVVGCGASLLALWLPGCGLFPPGTSSRLDLSVFKRSGFSRFSLAGSWSLSTSTGQTRLALFDEDGRLRSLVLPDGGIFEPGEDDTVEIHLTSFGAFSFLVRGDTGESDGEIVVHEFEGIMSDDATRIRGTVFRLANNLSGSRTSDLRETWVLVGDDGS